MTRLGHVGVLMLLFCVAFPFFGWPAVLWVLFLVPVAVAVWIERTRTTVSSAGLDLRTMFGSRHLDWSQIQGLRIPKRGFVRAHLIDDSEIALPAVSYDRLRHLVEASGGRIPDPFAQPEDPADGAGAEPAQRSEGVASDDDPETDPAPVPERRESSPDTTDDSERRE